MAIKFNMDQVEELITTYSVGEGQDQGYYSSSYEYSSNGQSGNGGPPGTDSNAEDTDYMLQGNGTTNSETILNKYNYLPNEDVQNIKREVGAVVPEESSIGIILTRYRKVSEEALEEQGALNDISFDEYIEQNSQVNTLEKIFCPWWQRLPESQRTGSVSGSRKNRSLRQKKIQGFWQVDLPII